MKYHQKYGEGHHKEYFCYWFLNSNNFTVSTCRFILAVQQHAHACVCTVVCVAFVYRRYVPGVCLFVYLFVYVSCELGFFCCYHTEIHKYTHKLRHMQRILNY